MHCGSGRATSTLVRQSYISRKLPGIRADSGNLAFFLIVIITYFSGALVWKDRDERVDEIADATPIPEWVSYGARLVTLVAMLMAIQAVALVFGIVDQAVHGYYRFQFGLYIHELLMRDLWWFVLLAILAFLIEALAPNKYGRYFVSITFYFVNGFLWHPLNVATYLVQFAGRPTSSIPISWRCALWFGVGLVHSLLAARLRAAWPRHRDVLAAGKQDRWQTRGRMAALRFGSGVETATSVSLLAFVACGGWIWYNTEILNCLLRPERPGARPA